MKLLLALAVALSALGACTSSPAQSTDGGAEGPCVVAVPCDDGAGFESAGACVACDGGAPSWATEIQPIIQGACLTCHGPGGTGGFDESSYAKVSAQAGSMLSQVNVCQMPPLNGPVLSDAQRVALTAWLRCGAPDN